MPTSDLIARLDNLPPMPDSCRRLEAKLADPQATSKDLSTIIAEDPALATQVLKMANSAYYAVPGGVDSLNRAVSCLGFSAIHQLVLCMQTYRLLQRTGPALPRWLTQHGSAAGGLCRHLASGERRALAPQAYVAGLLHDLGRLAIAVVAPEVFGRYLDAVAKGATHSLELERDSFGMDHQAAGAHLARRWRYPDSLICAVAEHHGPGPAADDRLAEQRRALADLVSVSDAWVAALGQPGIPGGACVALDPARPARLGLSAAPDAGQRDELIQAMNTSNE